MLNFLFLCHSVRGIFGKTQLCEVETGQTNIILDIEESRGKCEYLLANLFDLFGNEIGS